MVNESSRGSLKYRFLLGCGAGMTSSLILQPLDVIKTRIQGSVLVLNQKKKPRLLQTIRQIYTKEGVTGFWQGVKPSMLRSAFGPGIYFSVLEKLNVIDAQHVGDRSSNLNVGTKAAFARIVAGIIINPLSVIKTRFEWLDSNSNHIRKNKSIAAEVKHILKSRGIAGLFSGLIPTIFRDAPQSGLYFVFFSNLKEHIGHMIPEQRDTTTVISAIIAGIFSTFVTLPFDLLKTKYQLSQSLDERLGSSVSTIIQQRGISGLFSGGSTRLVRKPAQMTITWTIYELFR